MAIIRCEIHKPDPSKVKYYYYTHPPIKPLGYPNTALICGKKGCLKPGLVWLNEVEVEAYKSGEFVFSTRSGFSPGIKAETGAKVRVIERLDL